MIEGSVVIEEIEWHEMCVWIDMEIDMERALVAGCVRACVCVCLCVCVCVVRVVYWGKYSAA